MFRRLRAWWPCRFPQRDTDVEFAARVKCRCGWQSTLCESWEDAYEQWWRHAGL